jgi:transposase InsO family protein
MKSIFRALFAFLGATVRSRASMQLEILALRHQLADYERSVKRPRLRPGDRILWSWLSRIWSGWRDTLVIVQPTTVVAWQRRRFRDHWRKLCRSGKPGRPAVTKDIRDLIRRMSGANPLWGSPRIVGELRKIGIDVAQSTVEKYMVRPRKPTSPTWKAFLKNHLADTVAIDFFVVPTVRFHVLYVLLILAHDRRRVLHFNVTANPSAEWTAQQIVETFPWDEVPRYLLRDRDSIYGAHFKRRVRNMGIEQVVIVRRSPWQNPFVERLISSIRRECLDHVVVMNERNLKKILRVYLPYYHKFRTHLSLEKDAPDHRPVQTRDLGRVVEVPEVSGLHRHYERRAA